ncbi:hypothetical protein [Halalkalibacter flavus]|jgi:hypothetical protein|uniref:hypothetical protein n=1 Tax=Halalkalibacter flavus TaxID=3090668 RepID=UPI002FCA8CB9
MNNLNLRKSLIVFSLFSATILLFGLGAFQAIKVLGLTSSVATVLYWALWGGTVALSVAAIVSSFGIGTVAAGAAIRAFGRYGFKGFVNW